MMKILGGLLLGCLLLSCGNRKSESHFSSQLSPSSNAKSNIMQNPDLIAFVTSGDLESTKKHLAREVVNVTNRLKQNLLMIATLNDDFEMAKLLITFGADPNQQAENLDSPFLYAGASNQLDFVKLFLAHGARFGVFNRYHGTALIPAAERGHVEMVRLLANTPDFPIDHINRLGWTALIEAIILGDGSEKYVEIVKILLEAGADRNIPDGEGVTVFQHARKRGFVRILEVLEKG